MPEPAELNASGSANASWIIPHAPNSKIAMSPNTATVRRNTSFTGVFFCGSMARKLPHGLYLVKYGKM